jgi:hypothetical protein
VVSSPGLARQVEEIRARFNAARKLLRLVEVRADPFGAVLTFRPIAVGSTDLTLAVSGISKSVSVDIVPQSGGLTVRPLPVEALPSDCPTVRPSD